MNGSSKRAVIVVMTLVATAVLVSPTTVSSSGFGTSANPDHYVLGDNTIYWKSTETTVAHRNVHMPLWQWITEVEYDNRSSIGSTQVAASSLNFNMFWYVDPGLPPGVPADSICQIYLDPNQVPPTCARVRVRHSEAFLGREKAGLSEFLCEWSWWSCQ